MDALTGEDRHCTVLGRYSQGSLQKNERVLDNGMLINGTLVMRPRLLKVSRVGPPLIIHYLTPVMFTCTNVSSEMSENVFLCTCTCSTKPFPRSTGCNHCMYMLYLTTVNYIQEKPLKGGKHPLMKFFLTVHHLFFQPHLHRIHTPLYRITTANNLFQCRVHQ